MNSQQEKRFAKLHGEQFYLLDHKVGENLCFHISGSTKNIYTVTIYLGKKNIFCTCPDAKSWCPKYGCVCKHCLFVLYRVLRVFEGQNQPFFTTLLFDTDELDRIQLSTEYLQERLGTGITDEKLTKRFNELNLGNYQTTKPISFDKDDLCGVCFLELEEGSNNEYKACPTCNKVAHNECINKWISSKQYLCVYCRQEVWKNPGTKQSGNYKNLA
jgi:hypothetical protein